MKKTKWKTWHKVVLSLVGAFILIGIIAVATDDGQKTQVKSAASRIVKKGEVLHTDYFDVQVTDVQLKKNIISDGIVYLAAEDGAKYLRHLRKWKGNKVR